MAQAARLNLRMQKELKLLLTDPPHGATFPHLSPDSNPSSSSSSFFSTIHAQIEGPEGTVYAKGVFDINIQIPERYPFQPPSVTFATPIYHPNIDNGGRICLDILNLPPKGAWQPSLNISAVLTSIGLLLSEPNPDDGLMCEASREYKYNRHAFDQKARSMTEKFAMAGVGGSRLSMETNSNLSTVEVKVTADPKRDINEHVVNNKKLSGNRRKLSLESSVSGQTMGCEVKVNEVPDPYLFIANSTNQIEVEARGQDSKGTLLDYNSSHENLNRTRQRLSLESFSQVQKRDCNNQENAEDKHCPLQVSGSHEKQLHQDSISTCEERCTSSEEIWKQPIGALDTCGVSSFRHEVPQLTSSKPHFNESQGDMADYHHKLGSHKGYATTNMTSKKPCLAGKKLSLGNKGSSKKAEEDDKENVVPVQKLPFLNTKSPSKPCINHENSLFLSHSQSLSTNPSTTLPIQQACRNDEDQQRDRDGGGNIKQQVTEESPLSETVIVLDSEDSEEEKNTPVRTKLSLARRRLGKWKAKA